MAQAVASTSPSRLQREWRDWLLFALFVGRIWPSSPFSATGPLIYNAYLSFHMWDFLSPVAIPVGFDNYTDTLTSPAFSTPLKNTVVLMLGGVLSTLILGLALALLLNQKLAGRDFARGCCSRRTCSRARPSPSSGSTSSIRATGYRGRCSRR